jgi:target of rapamycin complex 2 subunit MAPKAP1
VFTAPDRTGRISKFNFEAYAVLEATPAQGELFYLSYDTRSKYRSVTVQQNNILESKIQRRPSRIMGKKKKQVADSGGLLAAAAPLVAPGTSAVGTSLGISPAFAALLPSSFPSSSQGPQLFLRIRVAETADAVHISTTIPV